MNNPLLISNIEVVKEDEWLSFELSERKPKTNVYDIISKHSGCILGEVKWYPSWRNYCFFANTLIETVHSDRCLLSIGEFILNINKQHRNKNGKQ